MILKDNDRIDVAININGRPMVSVPIILGELGDLWNHEADAVAALLDLRIKVAMEDSRAAFIKELRPT